MDSEGVGLVYVVDQDISTTFSREIPVFLQHDTNNDGNSLEEMIM